MTKLCKRRFVVASVCQKCTTGVWAPLTVLERTCRTPCYTHSVRRMPTCICARKIFAQVRTDFIFSFFVLLLALMNRCGNY